MTRLDISATLPYSVSLWGSDPNDGNDDCWTGTEFATLAEAEACLANMTDHFNAEEVRGSYILLEGVPENIFRVIAPKVRRRVQAGDDWQRERAMQAGMMGGCDAYNDEMGY